MTNYERGRRFEYQVRDFFREHGFLVIRAAQSKPIDLVCLKDGKSILVECKINRKAMRRQAREELVKMAESFHTIAVFAYKEKRQIRLLNTKTNDPYLLSF
jgi:Holliday junction resolvase